MYQSPIEIIQKQMRTEFEDNVYKAVQSYGVAVDKDELIKALQYDRGQYEKGYAEAKREVAREIFEELDKYLTDDKLGLFTYRYYKNVVAEIKKEYITAEAEESKAEEKEFFTPDEVRKMSRAEVEANYPKIINSMSKWH